MVLEPGACILLAAPSNGGLQGVVTADAVHGAGYVADANHTTSFGGPSSATPLVAGVAHARARAARPGVARRARRARRVGARNGGPRPTTAWAPRNAAGKDGYPYYGAGAVDAEAEVRLAAAWAPLGPEEREAVAAPREPLPAGVADAPAGAPSCASTCRRTRA